MKKGQLRIIPVPGMQRFVLIRGERQIILKSFSTKYEGFHALLELLDEKQITWDEIPGIAQKIAQCSKIRFSELSTDGNYKTKAECMSALYSIVEPPKIIFKNLKLGSTLYFTAKQISKLPGNIQFEDEMGLKWAQIVLKEPWVEKLDNNGTYKLQRGLSDPFRYRDTGLTILFQEYQIKKQFNKVSHDRLRDEIEALDFPRSLWDISSIVV